jgi:hypothetical protein
MIYQPFMFSYLSTYIAKDIIFYTITTISTSIMSIQNINNFIINHKDNDNIVFHNLLEKIDLLHNLHLTNVLIKDIIQSHTDNNDKGKLNDLFDNMDTYNEQIVEDDTCVRDYNIVSRNHDINNIRVDLPEPVKLSIATTLEIIHKINIVFEKIQKKMITYKNSFLKIYKLNIATEMSQISLYNDIFHSRLELMIKTIGIYRNKVFQGT